MRGQPTPFRLGNISHFELRVLENALLRYIGKPRMVGGELPPKPRDPEIREARSLLRLISEGRVEIEQEWGEKCR